MTETVATAVRLAADHPLEAVSLLVFVAIPLVVGWMHEARYLAECSIVGIRFFKHEVALWRGFVARLKRELSTWDVEK